MDKTGCYEKAKSLGYSVFAINNGKECYTSASAWTTYKKYGPIECNNSRSNEVFQIKKGTSSVYLKTICMAKCSSKLWYLIYWIIYSDSLQNENVPLDTGKATGKKKGEWIA